MRRAESAVPVVPFVAIPFPKCEWCGVESDGQGKSKDMLVSVCHECGRASTSRTARAVSQAPTRKYPAFKVEEGAHTDEEIDALLDFEMDPESVRVPPTKNGKVPPALPKMAEAKAAPKLPPPRTPAKLPVAKLPEPKVSLVSRPETDTALTIPVPGASPKAGIPRPVPRASAAPAALSIIPARGNAKANPLGTADTGLAPAYAGPSVSIMPIISIPPPPVSVPEMGLLPRISIVPSSGYPEVAANDAPSSAPSPRRGTGTAPHHSIPASRISAANKTVRLAPAVLATPLAAASGPLAAYEGDRKPLRAQLQTVKVAAGRGVATRMLPFVLGGIAVGLLAAAAIIAKTHVVQAPAPSTSAVAVVTASSPSPQLPAQAPVTTADPMVSSPVATAAVVTRPAAPAPVEPAPQAFPPTEPVIRAEKTAKSDGPDSPEAAVASLAALAGITPPPATIAPEAPPTQPVGSIDDAKAARASGNLDRASAIFNSLAAGSDVQLDAYMGLAEIARSRGDLGSAKSAYIRALSSAPGYLPAALGAADSAWELGGIEEARARYHRIQEKYPVRMLPPRVAERARLGDEKTP